MAASHMALLLVCLAILASSVTSQRRCDAFQWRSDLNIPDPVSSQSGKVVLVALLKGYCRYCVEQVAALERLKTHLATQGFTDISMTIVNGGDAMSRNSIANLEGASDIPVIQDTEDHVMFSEIFRGNKDDFILYDRCGQRAFTIPHPYSYLGHSITERALKALHMGRQRCFCRLDPSPVDPYNTMYGDQPMTGPGYGVARRGNELDLECPHNDRWCRRYMRNLRRNTLGLSSDLDPSRMANRARFIGISNGNPEENEDRGHRGQGRRGHSAVYHRSHHHSRHGSRVGGAI